MIDKTVDAMKEDDQMQKALWKWQSRFLFRRQAPQEILKAGEEDEDNEEGSAAEDMNGVPVLTE